MTRKKILVLHPDPSIHGDLASQAVGLFDTKKFNDLALDLRDLFSDYIDSLNNKRALDVAWWSTPLANSRDCYGSTLFQDICYLTYCGDLIDKGIIPDEIVCHSEAVAACIRKRYPSLSSSVSVKSSENAIRKRFRRLVGAGRFLQLAMQISLARFNFRRDVSRRRNSLLKEARQGEIALVDMMLMPTGIRDGGISSYQWTRALPKLTERGWWVSPVAIGFESYHQFYGAISGLAKSRLIIREDWIGWRDYAWCLFSMARLAFESFFQRTYDFNGYNVTPLIRSNMVGAAPEGICQLLLHYRFLKRLRKAGVQLSRVLDWYENQALDKVFNIGLLRYFPKTRRAGYMSISCSRFAMHFQPSPIDAKLSPPALYVVGRAWVPSSLKYFPSLKVGVAPALGFPLMEEKEEDSLKQNAVACLLPLGRTDALGLIQLVKDYVSTVSAPLDVWVRCHPGATPDERDEYRKVLNNTGIKFSESKELLIDWLKQTGVSIILSSASSVLVYCYTMGYTVLINASRGSLVHDPFPESADGDCCAKYIYSKDDLIRALNSTDQEAERIKSSDLFEGSNEVAVTQWVDEISR